MSDSRPYGLSGEQLRALDPRIRLVEAGPGAGKTRTVVARLRSNFEDGRRVAMLSFTNAAVDVARLRGRDVPQLLEAPNFVGTFDAFFRRYVVTPATIRSGGRPPTYLASWDDLRNSMAVVRPDNGGVGIRLTRFVQQKGVWAIDVDLLSRMERLAWEKLTDWSRQNLNTIGHQRITALRKAQVYDTTSARKRALEILDLAESPLPLLVRRFNEIIIDEFQDCDEIEHNIVHRLSSAGISVVAVADPDQAIYEFRQANSTLYEQYRNGVAEEERVVLSTCYRSSPVICSVINSLRTVGLGQIVPDVDHAGGSTGVHVVVGSGVKAGACAYKILRECGVSLTRTRVIAHRKSDARSLLRTGKEPPHGSSQVEMLLVPLADLRSGADPSGRMRAIRRVESFVLSQFDWDGRGLEGRNEQIVELGVASEELRGIASALLKASLTWTDSISCKAELRSILEGFASRTQVGLRPRLGNRLTIPEKVWDFWTSRTLGLIDDVPDALRWGHVHGVKGDEFQAVIMAIPAKTSGSSHVLDDWQGGINSEQRRVLYVGVSRAMQELVLVVPPSRRVQLEAVLADANIEYTVTVA